MERREADLRLLRIHLNASRSISDMLKTDMERYGVKWNEFVVLELLYQKGKFSTQEISATILLPASSLTYVLDRLEVKRLIKRESDEKDRRYSYVSLTEEGERLISEAFEEHADTIQDIYSVFSHEEVKELSEQLKEVGYHAQNLYQKTTKGSK